MNMVYMYTTLFGYFPNKKIIKNKQVLVNPHPNKNLYNKQQRQKKRKKKKKKKKKKNLTLAVICVALSGAMTPGSDKLLKSGLCFYGRRW